MQKLNYFGWAPYPIVPNATLHLIRKPYLVCANTPFSVLFIVHLSMGGERVVRGGERVVRGGERVVRGGERVVRGGEKVAVQTKIDGQKERGEVRILFNTQNLTVTFSGPRKS